MHVPFGLAQLRTSVRANMPRPGAASAPHNSAQTRYSFGTLYLLCYAEMGMGQENARRATWYPSVPESVVAGATIGLEQGSPERKTPNGSRPDRGSFETHGEAPGGSHEPHGYVASTSALSGSVNARRNVSRGGNNPSRRLDYSPGRQDNQDPAFATPKGHMGINPKDWKRSRERDAEPGLFIAPH